MKWLLMLSLLMPLTACQSETYKKGYADAIADGKTTRYAKAYARVYADAIARGKTEPYARVYADAIARGRRETDAESYADAYVKAYAEARARGKDEAYAYAYAEARERDWKTKAYADAYAEALARGKDKAYAAAIAAIAAKKKQEEDYNKSRLSKAKAFADSGDFMTAYGIMEALPDSLIKEEDLDNVVEPALRQSIKNFNAVGATKALSALPLDLEHRPLYVQAVEVLNAYKVASRELDYIDVDEIDKEIERLRRLRTQNCRLPFAGYITRKWSDHMYEAQTSNGELFVLKTEKTVFTSTGFFTLHIDCLHKEPMKLSSGFTKEVPICVEDSERPERCRQVTQELKEWEDAKKEIPSLKKKKRLAYQKLRQVVQALDLSIPTENTE